jgi:hypothetical protein
VRSRFAESDPDPARDGSLAEDERNFAVGHSGLQKHARRNETGDQYDGLQYGECDHLSLLSYPPVSRSRLWGGSGKNCEERNFLVAREQLFADD